MADPKHVVGAEVLVMNDDKKILLIKNPKRGWELPGGGVESGESIRNAAIREVKEEAGIDVQLLKFCGVHQNLTLNICNNIFIGEPIGGELTTSNESLEVGYYTLTEAYEMIDRQYLRERISYVMDKSTHPFLLEYNLG
jgi:8-oxo-dGTP diphosphatase